MVSGWEYLCKAAKWYSVKSVFMREARQAWNQVHSHVEGDESYRVPHLQSKEQ